MKFGRDKSEQSSVAISLPERAETVTLVPSVGAAIPARVLESAPDTLLVAITVAIEPLTPAQLQGLALEFQGHQGRVRMTSTAAIEDPATPDVLRLTALRSLDVVQQREHVRIRSARRVLVFGGENLAHIDGFTIDISGGGFLLAGADLLKIGDQVQFQLELAEGEPPICGGGKVVRVDPQGHRGIGFTSMTDADERRLVHYIFDCQRAELRLGIAVNSDHGD